MMRRSFLGDATIVCPVLILVFKARLSVPDLNNPLILLVPAERLELPTYWLQISRSTNWAKPAYEEGFSGNASKVQEDPCERSREFISGPFSTWSRLRMQSVNAFVRDRRLDARSPFELRRSSHGSVPLTPPLRLKLNTYSSRPKASIKNWLEACILAN